MTIGCTIVELSVPGQSKLNIWQHAY